MTAGRRRAALLGIWGLLAAFGVLWGWIFLGETLPGSALAGGALILAGTLLVTRG